MVTQKTPKMRIPRIRPHDSLLYEQPQYTGTFSFGTTFELTVFNKSGADTFSSSSVDILTKMDSAKVNWLWVRGLSDVDKIQELCRQLGFPTLWVQDVLNTRHIAKIEEGETQILTILDHFSLLENRTLVKEHLGLWIMESTVVLFQESEQAHFMHVQEAILKNRVEVRAQGADYLYNLLFSSVIDDYLTILDRQRDLLLDIEEELMDFEHRHGDIHRTLQLMRKDYLLLRKNILPLREAYRELLESGVIKPSNEIYYRDTHDHLLQVFQLIDNARESIAALVDLYMSNNDLRMNQIMSRLTIISTIFIPLTFLAGIWGMNFQVMPELSWHYGYLFAWGSMVTVAMLVILWFKKKRWF